MNNTLNTSLIHFIYNQEDAEANWKLALAYEKMGQTAAAISYFLRASERTESKLLAYECLLKVALMFIDQGDRNFTVQGILKNAISFMPDRPEAYYLMARSLERSRDWLSSYMFAAQGLVFADQELVATRTNVDYPGKYGLIYQRAVASWWAGKGQECRKLFRDLAENYISQLDPEHYLSVERNLLNLGTGPEHIAFTQYHKDNYATLRYKFPGADKIERSSGQVMQDMFVLSMTNGKRNGTYLEIGSAKPFHGNNTALLEKDFGWTGMGVEFQQQFVDEYRAHRTNPVLCQDALTIDYTELLTSIAKDGVVDYLQLDCEPSKITYDIMQLIPFDKFKFAVITYEHDHYVDMTKQYRKLSREFLTSQGYELVIGNVSPDGISPFEDWWVHPDLVSREIIDIMRDADSAVIAIDAHMFQGKKISQMSMETSKTYSEPVLSKPAFDWGTLSEIDAITIQREVEEERVYDFWRSVQQGDVVVDIGASTGAFTCHALVQQPSKIYCVEPSSSLMTALKHNVKNAPQSNTEMIYVDHAIADESTANVHVFGSPDAFVSVPFKNFIADNNITKIDFLKIDCEGGEYDIFTEENMDFLLNNVDFMAVEVHTYYPGNRDQFKWMRDNILPRFANYELISCTYQPIAPGQAIDLKTRLQDDAFVDAYPCQFMLYIWNNLPDPRKWFPDSEEAADNEIAVSSEITNTVLKTFHDISSHARNRVWVVDDFYADPDAVRSFALDQQFDQGGIGRGYIGNRTHEQFLFPGLKERFEQIMGRPITKWSEHGMNGRFQTAIAGDPLVYHCDDQKYAGMLYLTPNAPWEAGTTLWATKKGGARDYYSPTWNEEFSNKKTFLDRTPYTPVDVVGNVYNRLVIFDASSIHSASDYFGYAPDNCRLWQMFFFD